MQIDDRSVVFMALTAGDEIRIETTDEVKKFIRNIKVAERRIALDALHKKR
jgi:hypothetical protein